MCRAAWAAGLASLLACAPPQPVRLGFIGGLSGRVADLGGAGRDGAMLAVEMRNQAGGVKGRRVELLVEDDQQNAVVARQAVDRLIARKVDAIVGPMTSAMATVSVPLANAASVVMISPTVTTNALTGLDDHFFRVLAPTRVFARKSADYHFARVGLRRVVAVSDLRNRIYTESWLEDYRAAFAALGGKLVGHIGFYSDEDTDFSDLARQLLRIRADGVLILANSVDAAMLCQHLRKLDAAIPIATSEWAATEQLIELGGRAVEGALVAQFVDRQSREPAWVEFRQNYRTRFGREPGFAGLAGFDAATVVLEAIAQQAPGESLKQSLLRRRTFAATQSPVVFDAFGDTARETYLTTVNDGAFLALR